MPDLASLSGHGQPIAPKGEFDQSPMSCSEMLNRSVWIYLSILQLYTNPNNELTLIGFHFSKTLSIYVNIFLNFCLPNSIEGFVKF